MTSTSGSDKQQ